VPGLAKKEWEPAENEHFTTRQGQNGVCKERRNNQMDAMVAVGGNCSTAEMDDNI